MDTFILENKITANIAVSKILKYPLLFLGISCIKSLAVVYPLGLPYYFLAFVVTFTIKTSVENIPACEDVISKIC